MSGGQPGGGVAGAAAGGRRFTHADSELRRAPHELGRDARRFCDTVLPAGDGADDVVGVQSLETSRVDVFDRDAERLL